MVPNKELDMMEDSDDEDDYGSARSRDKAIDLQPTPTAQQVPFTPRTQAFHALERKLPLRTTYV